MFFPCLCFEQSLSFPLFNLFAIRYFLLAQQLQLPRYNDITNRVAILNVIYTRYRSMGITSEHSTILDGLEILQELISNGYISYL